MKSFVEIACLLCLSDETLYKLFTYFLYQSTAAAVAYFFAGTRLSAPDESMCDDYQTTAACKGNVTSIDCSRKHIYIVDGFYSRKDKEMLVADRNSRQDRGYYNLQP